MPQAVTQRKSTQIMNKNLYKDVKVWNKISKWFKNPNRLEFLNGRGFKRCFRYKEKSSKDCFVKINDFYYNYVLESSWIKLIAIQ